MSETRRISVVQICVLMLLHGYALGMYVIPMVPVLIANGLKEMTTFPYIVASIAAFISPLIFGSLADRRFAPERLLATVVLVGAGLLALTYACILQRWGTWQYGIIASCYYLWMAPAWGLMNGIALAHLKDPQKEFGNIRVWATIGFMLGGFSASKVFHADTSAIGGFIGAGVFVAEAVFLCTLPPTHRTEAAKAKNWREVLGWDAFKLLKDRDHRTIYIASALFNIPLCVFYIYPPMQLQALGDQTPAASMSAAQIMEVVSLIGLASLMGKVRLKWLMAAGIFLGAVRYALYMGNTYHLMQAGILLHGLIFTLFYMTTQIYVEQRIDPSMRNQAQALLNLMTNGVGALSGFFILNQWHHLCTQNETTDWWKFWEPTVIAILAILAWFLWSYRGKKVNTSVPT